MNDDKQFSFFALASRLKKVQRWQLMHCSGLESVAEHSFEVAILAHGLVLIRREIFSQNDVSPDKAASYALLHDVSEVITGDMPTPSKYSSDSFRNAYKELESSAASQLVGKAPTELKDIYSELLEVSEPYRKIIKAADKLSAYLKCLEELVVCKNQDFQDAYYCTMNAVLDMADTMPELQWFLDHCVNSYSKSLDSMLRREG